jgi:hypothetical protein
VARTCRVPEPATTVAAGFTRRVTGGTTDKRRCACGVALSVNDPDRPHRYIQARCVVEHVDPDPGAEFYRTLQRRYSWPTGTGPDAADRIVIRARPKFYSTQNL